MKTRKIKAKAIYSGKAIGQTKPGISDWKWHPVWELPRTVEAYDQMTEQMAWGIAADELCRPKSDAPWSDCYGSNTRFYDSARAALRALGITRPKEEKTK